MAKSSPVKCIGILTAGGDCPGLNPAIRAVTKTAQSVFGMRVIGIQDGFRGLVENRTVQIEDQMVSGILTRGGTILGTSRDRPHKMTMGGKTLNMIPAAVENARRLQIDCLVCLGGGGTQKNALRLARDGGIRVVTLPKTIDNDIVETDISFGHDTAVGIATEAIDRLHTTATSHHRIIVCETMGNKSGWLALRSGLAGGADVILIPEIPYDLGIVASALMERRRTGKKFSIIAVAEGANPGSDDAEEPSAAGAVENGFEDSVDTAPVISRRIGNGLVQYHEVQEPIASRIARELQELTGTDARVTTLGHVQRGGIPSAFDRILCTQLGTRAVELIAEGRFNVMVAYRSGECVPVPLEDVAGPVNMVPVDHPLVESARKVGTCFGD
ncbi:6-phosphofructokinase [Candidatus Fermentibacteria bacterium]|nr:6-phosphofructokinase [Candidatus Fermentibacteria bacterium]